MKVVKDIQNNITDLVQQELGLDYSKLNHVIDHEQNNFKGNTRRYGVIPSSANETDGQNQGFTMDHSFTVKLTDSYQFGANQQISDNEKLRVTNELQDKALRVYKHLQANKTNVLPEALIINDLSVSEVEYVEEERVAVLEFSLNVKYFIRKG